MQELIFKYARESGHFGVYDFDAKAVAAKTFAKNELSKYSSAKASPDKIKKNVESARNATYAGVGIEISRQSA